jgi:hypothetical protein
MDICETSAGFVLREDLDPVDDSTDMNMNTNQSMRSPQRDSNTSHEVAAKGVTRSRDCASTRENFALSYSMDEDGIIAW